MRSNREGIVWTLALLFGVGIGLLWLAISILVFISAGEGFANDRSDWGTGWALVATLFLAAGLSAIFGTLWHRRLVKRHY